MNAAIKDESKQNLNEVKSWLGKMAERGVYGATPARLRATAIEQISSILVEEEPHEVGYMVANLDDITVRWARKHSIKPETAQTYKSRAKGALEDFLLWNENPTGFKPKVRVVPTDTTKKPPERKRPALAVPDQTQLAVAPPAAASPAPSSQLEKSYTLRDGSDFQFRLPAKGITIHDVQRISWHLATLATDFDPTQEMVRNPLAPVKRD